MRRPRTAPLVGALAIALGAQSAHAYLDPSAVHTGIQWAVGIASAAGAGLGVLWHRIAQWRKRTPKRAQACDTTQPCAQSNPALRTDDGTDDGTDDAPERR